MPLLGAITVIQRGRKKERCRRRQGVVSVESGSSGQTTASRVDH